MAIASATATIALVLTAVMIRTLLVSRLEVAFDYTVCRVLLDKSEVLNSRGLWALFLWLQRASFQCTGCTHKANVERS